MAFNLKDSSRSLELIWKETNVLLASKTIPKFQISFCLVLNRSGLFSVVLEKAEKHCGVPIHHEYAKNSEVDTVSSFLLNIIINVFTFAIPF